VGGAEVGHSVWRTHTWSLHVEASHPFLTSYWGGYRITKETLILLEVHFAKYGRERNHLSATLGVHVPDMGLGKKTEGRRGLACPVLGGGKTWVSNFINAYTIVRGVGNLQEKGVRKCVMLECDLSGDTLEGVGRREKV